MALPEKRTQSITVGEKERDNDNEATKPQKMLKYGTPQGSKGRIHER